MKQTYKNSHPQCKMIADCAYNDKSSHTASRYVSFSQPVQSTEELKSKAKK